jgi:UDP-N-acetylglucosamine transferase subunit ALG13
VIFVTVGTHHQPFTRLIEGLQRLPAEDLVVQYGSAPRAPRAVLAVRFMSFDEVVRHTEAANVMITHAGVGSILLALRAGHVPIAVPRLRRHGEHVDDHQVELTSALEKRGVIEAVWEMAELAAAVARVRPRSAPRVGAPGRLHAAVEAALSGDSGG